MSRTVRDRIPYRYSQALLLNHSYVENGKRWDALKALLLDHSSIMQASNPATSCIQKNFKSVKLSVYENEHRTISLSC
jgi:hypothetical protein